MASHKFEWTSRNLAEGLSPAITVVNDAGVVQESGNMTHVYSGRYFYTFTSSTADKYYAKVVAEGRTTLLPTVDMGTAVIAADTITALNTTYLHVKHRLGDLEANIGTGSANIVSQAISGAQSIIDEMTGAKTTGESSPYVITFAVADYASGMVVDTMLGADTITVSNERLQMAENFKKRATEAANAVGRNIRYSKVN